MHEVPGRKRAQLPSPESMECRDLPGDPLLGGPRDACPCETKRRVRCKTTVPDGDIALKACSIRADALTEYAAANETKAAQLPRAKDSAMRQYRVFQIEVRNAGRSVAPRKVDYTYDQGVAQAEGGKVFDWRSRGRGDSSGQESTEKVPAHDLFFDPSVTRQIIRGIIRSEVI